MKDKSKMTGEGSEEIKSFPQFDDLDQIWGTRDSVSPKYVVEAGTSQPVTSTPVPSPNSSIGASGSNSAVPSVELGESTDDSDVVEESASLLSSISRSKNLRKKEKVQSSEKASEVSQLETRMTKLTRS